MKNIILIFIFVTLVMISLSGCAMKTSVESLLDMDVFQSCDDLTLNAKSSGTTIKCKKHR